MLTLLNWMTERNQKPLNTLIYKKIKKDQTVYQEEFKYSKYSKEIINLKSSTITTKEQKKQKSNANNSSNKNIT